MDASRTGTPDHSPTASNAPAGVGAAHALPQSGGVELAKAYKPSEHEAGVWSLWMRERAFHADPQRVRRGEAQPYAIVIPPPNVTAALHLGHALNNTLQDVLACSQRMMGREVLWMPGTDHAGIATQAVVEKRLRKEGKLKGALKDAMPRDVFLGHIQAFKDEYEATITKQLQAMGCSCDWDRQRFTMDDQCAAAVQEAFFRLFQGRLIDRGKRLVNWDPVLQTAVADDECYDEEIDGAFHYLRYPLVRVVQGEDAAPVTWDELARRGYPGAEEHPGEAQAWLTVATTRPETYLGDTAVAVNPHDPRAKSLRGLFVELPLVGRVIPVIEDSYVVLPERYARTEEERNDPKAGMATGFLKVTPAHDPNDWEIGQRHSLRVINVMAPDGSISDKHGWSDVGDAHLFVGKKREEARKLVLREFDARGLLEGVKPHRHSVKHSDRSKAIVEPYLSDQWYVKVTDPRLAQAANAALHEGKVTFHPERYAKTYEQWHDGIRDWCISRQLWWGHRIPVWKFSPGDIENLKGKAWSPEHEAWLEELLAQVAAALKYHAKFKVRWIRDAMSNAFFVCTNSNQGALLLEHLEEHQRAVLSQTPGVIRQPTTAVDRMEEQPRVLAELATHAFRHLKQDLDVLDTWFSSALWPLSTMGWPNPKAFNEESNKDLLKAFNPTSVLCTAREIITLWVSRMVMFNRFFLGMDRGPAPGAGDVPFRDVYIHAVIQDGEGRKMSKSLGNGVDPLDIIATHGSDAMRFTLCQMATNTQDVRLPVVKDPQGRNTSPKFDLGRNFANKLWNASRFALSMIPPDADGTPAQRAELSLLDRWMLSRLEAGVSQATRALAEYQFAEYATTLYDLLWRDYCDWYLEGVKPTIQKSAAQRAVLAASLEAILRLLHPVMPYVTEAVYQHARGAGALARAARGAAGLGVVLHADSRDVSLLARAAWPRVDASLRDEASERDFQAIKNFATIIRDVRASQQVKPSRRIRLITKAGDPALTPEFAALLATFAGLSAVSAGTPGAGGVAVRVDNRDYHLDDLRDTGEADAGAQEAEKARLEKKISDLTKSVATLEGRLANPGYSERAPAAMVQQTRDQLEKARGELEDARTRWASMS